MRKRKILFLLAFLSIVLAGVACNQHTCAPSENWTYDENGHWHTCEGCERRFTYFTITLCVSVSVKGERGKASFKIL